MKKLIHGIIVIAAALAGNQVSAQTTVGFTYNESLVFVKAKINNSKASYTFLVNTGANATVIDKKVANALKLPIQSEKDEVLGTAGSEHIEIRKANSIAIGTAVVKNLQITSRDINNIMPNGQKIDGILGTDFLEKFCYTIDFQERKITFTGQKMDPGKQRCIPFEMTNGIPRISARINDNYQTYLHYNSGVSMPYSKNSYVNVSSKQWEEIKKINPYMGQSNTMLGKGIGGDLQMQSLKVSNIKLNETNIQNPYVVVQAKEGYFKNDDAIGFFSNSTLEKYPKVTVDFIGQNIILYDYKKPAKKAVIKKPVVAQK